MATGPFTAIRNGMLTLGVCAGLAAGALGAGATAEARVNGPRTTQMAWECGLYQDAYDQAKRDLRNAKTAIARIKAQNALDRAVDNWYDNGCYELFGRLSGMVQGDAPVKYQDSIVQTDNPQVASAGDVVAAPGLTSELSD